MSWTSDAGWTSVHILTSRWQHHSKLGCQSCAPTFHTHTQSRAHTLSQAATKMPAGVSTTLSSTALHLFCMRKRQTAKRRDDTVGLETDVFFSMCVCTVVCERQRKYWKWVREGAGSGLIRPLLIAGGLSEILFLLLCLDFFQLGQ